MLGKEINVSFYTTQIFHETEHAEILYKIQDLNLSSLSTSLTRLSQILGQQKNLGLFQRWILKRFWGDKGYAKWIILCCVQGQQ